MTVRHSVLEEQKMCFQLKLKGLSRREISEQTGLSERQVKRRLQDHYKMTEGYGHEEESNNFKHFLVEKINGDKIQANSSKKKYFNIPTDSEATDDIFVNLVKELSKNKHMKETNEPTDDELFKMFPSEKDSTLYSYHSYDKRREDISNFIERKYKGTNVKILNLSDLHVPFTDYEMVKKIITKHNDANILVINGDLLDLFSVSRYSKDKAIGLKREIQEARKILEVASQIFDDVVVTEGNHERRLKHYIKDVIPEDIQFLFSMDILDLVVDGDVIGEEPIKNVHVVGSWWIDLFDIIYAHPDNYSSVPLRTVTQTSNFFSTIKKKPHRMAVIGHTHQAGELMLPNGIKVIESGCSCHDMDYHKGSKFVSTTWVKAYTVAYVNGDGEVDLNNSRMYLY